MPAYTATRLSMIGLASALVLGCTTVTPDSELRPAAHVLAPDLLRADPAAALVVIKRDQSSLSGIGCKHRIDLDARPVVWLSVGQGVSLYVTPGPHVLSVSTPDFPCPGAVIEAGFEARAGQRMAFRVGQPTGGDIMLMPTAF